MTVEVWGMMTAGAAALVAGLALVRSRFRAAAGANKVLVLAPVFEATPLAIFGAEHFTAAHDLMPIVPKWLPGPLFWVYLVGAALLAAALSFIAWRCVRWSAGLLAFMFLIIVATVDLPNLGPNVHDRIFWTLTVRETCFAGGAMVLAGSVWPLGASLGGALVAIGRAIVAAVMVFYGVEHFFFPHNVVGVPLEKITPAYIPAPTFIAYFVGIVLIVAGIGLFFRRAARIAAAACGSVLLVVTLLFYGPIMVAQMHGDAVEGINYFGDTLLFTATVLLVGFGAERGKAERVASPVARMGDAA
jgi:uncharacterized membrane protein